MRQIKCPNCGAPVPVPYRGAEVTCRFCGSEFMAASRGFFMGYRRAPNPIVAAVVVALAVAAGVFFMVNLRPGAPPPAPVGTALEQVHHASTSSGVPPSELSRLSGQHGWFDLDVPDPGWTWTALDPVEGIRWSLDLAKKWSTDARLGLAFVRGLEPSGTVDVSAREDRELDVRFFSPKLRESTRALRAVSERKIESEFRISIREHRIRALLSLRSDVLRDHDPPDCLPECPGPTLLQTWKNAGLEPRPTYDLALQFVRSSRFGKGYWRWTVKGSVPGDSLNTRPIDPKDCTFLR